MKNTEVKNTEKIESTSKPKEDQALENAYRLAHGLLRMPFSYRQTPSFHDQDALSAQQLQLEVQDYDAEIKFLTDVLDGKIKPRFIVIEGEGSMMSAKARTEEEKTDREILNRGLEILKRRRRVYARRLTWLKLQQPTLQSSMKKAQEINEKASQTINELDDVIKQKLVLLRELAVHYNELNSKHAKLNLDANQSLPPFPSLPRHISALKGVYQLDF